jgi:ABC-2 type transport system ATP-binding protein
LTILLQTQELTKKYGDFTALNAVSLTLNQGDIYGLVGRNGAGKTTFFKCVMGLAKPTGGKIKISASRKVTDVAMRGKNAEATLNAAGAEATLNAAGATSHAKREQAATSRAKGEQTSPHALSVARRQIGFMISPAFFSYLNPKQNLEYLRTIKGIHDKGEVKRLLKLVGLEDVKKPFKAFSLGMKQRLGIAAAMLGNPPIVVLDEPINGLDPQGIADIRAVIQRENAERGTTFIISSHILSELDLVATRFGFIEQGNLVQEITHTKLHEHTKKSLIVDVNDGQKALVALKSRFAEMLVATEAVAAGSRLIIESHLDQPEVIAKTLIDDGVELYRLSPQETTLEEYFMRLIGGKQDV